MVETSGFKIVQNKPTGKFPQLVLFMGKPKVGKSTKMAELKDALILATDPYGYAELDVKSMVEATSLEIINSAIKWFFSNSNTQYTNLVIDDIRSLTQMYDSNIKKKEGVKYSVDIGYGRGTAYLKDDIYIFLSVIRGQLNNSKDKRVILVAHADDKNNETRLDVNGKNESLILGFVDAVGFVDRDIDGNTTVNFSYRKNAEFGSRNKNLSNYEGVFNWDDLFKIAAGNKANEK